MNCKIASIDAIFRRSANDQFSPWESKQNWKLRNNLRLSMHYPGQMTKSKRSLTVKWNVRNITDYLIYSSILWSLAHNLLYLDGDFSKVLVGRHTLHCVFQAFNFFCSKSGLAWPLYEREDTKSTRHGSFCVCNSKKIPNQSINQFSKILCCSCRWNNNKSPRKQWQITSTSLQDWVQNSWWSK